MENLVQIYLNNNNSSGINGKDYLLQDDGDGIYVKYWNIEGVTEPTIQQLLELQSSDAQKLVNAKKSKLAQITPARDAFMYADIEYNGSFFTNSQVSGNNLTAEIATQTSLVEWLDSSGNQVDLTLAQAMELSALIKAKRRAGYFQEAAFISQINAINLLDEEGNEIQYFDEEGNEITALQALNNINIEF